MNVNGTEEDVCYKIAPCKGVKVCGNADCSYGPERAKPVQIKNTSFYYIWPRSEDKKNSFDLLTTPIKNNNKAK